VCHQGEELLRLWQPEVWNNRYWPPLLGKIGNDSSSNLNVQVHQNLFMCSRLLFRINDKMKNMKIVNNPSNFPQALDIKKSYPHNRPWRPIGL
jgi:hypothetical protein